MNFDEENVKKSRELSDEAVRGMSATVCVLATVITMSFFGFGEEKTYGVVKNRDDKTMTVQNLKDTILYNVFKYDDKMTVDKKRAFSYVAPGDTLEYVLPESTNVVQFSAARKVNGRSMVEFAKQRQRIAESVKTRNGLNQKTK